MLFDILTLPFSHSLNPIKLLIQQLGQLQALGLHDTLEPNFSKIQNTICQRMSLMSSSEKQLAVDQPF